eukprot:Nk52_evm12s2309 gene=Nk52_evmTU12s2309
MEQLCVKVNDMEIGWERFTGTSQYVKDVENFVLETNRPLVNLIDLSGAIDDDKLNAALDSFHKLDLQTKGFRGCKRGSCNECVWGNGHWAAHLYSL